MSYIKIQTGFIKMLNSPNFFLLLEMSIFHYIMLCFYVKVISCAYQFIRINYMALLNSALLNLLNAHLCYSCSHWNGSISAEKPLHLERPLGVGSPWGIKDFKSASLFPLSTGTHIALISWKPSIKKTKSSNANLYFPLATFSDEQRN